MAVADGSLYNVGYNGLGGWRLWLRDGGGTTFYFAHLSAYSAAAREGASVSRGTVIGYVGNTRRRPGRLAAPALRDPPRRRRTGAALPDRQRLAAGGMTVGPATTVPAGRRRASSSASSAWRGSTSRSTGSPSPSRGTPAPAASSQRA